MAQRLATVAEIRLVAPSFGATGDPDPPVTDATIELWSRIAGYMIGLDRWGDMASDGHALLAAHFIQLDPAADGDEGGGTLASATVGPVSASYTNDAPVDEILSTTTYGKAYQALRQVAASPGTAIVSNTAIRLG